MTEIYCTTDQARILSELDTEEMPNATFEIVQEIFAVPIVDSRFRAEGYAVPFATVPNTPPLVRSMTAMLTAAYASKSSYEGHDPNESPNYDTLMRRINKLFKDILDGDLELLDKSGNIILRTQTTSTGMLSTTDGEEPLFNLDDVPDITEIMSDGVYIGRDET